MEHHNLQVIREYFESGELMSEHFLNENQEITGVSRYWHINGQLMVEASYCDGLAEGVHRMWAENGTLIQYAELQHGKHHGFFQFWSENGTLLEEGYYLEGERQIGYRWYKPDGTLWSVFEATKGGDTEL